MDLISFRRVGRERAMSRVALVCCFAALLGSCTQNYQAADWTRARLA